MLPVAAGANGQPPMPPLLASRTVTPRLDARRARWRTRCCGCCGSGSAAGRPVHARGRAAASARDVARGRRRRWCRRARSRRRPASAPWRTRSATRSARTSPSNGQPNAAATVTRDRAARRRGPSAAMRRRGPIASAVVIALVALAENVVGGDDDAVDLVHARRASARSRPRSVEHQADVARRRRAAGTAARTASASAICGTRRRVDEADRLDPAQPGREPRLDVARPWRHGRAPASSFCSPSRGPTSTISSALMPSIMSAYLHAISHIQPSDPARHTFCA